MVNLQDGMYNAMKSVKELDNGENCLKALRFQV